MLGRETQRKIMALYDESVSLNSSSAAASPSSIEHATNDNQPAGPAQAMTAVVATIRAPKAVETWHIIDEFGNETTETRSVRAASPDSPLPSEAAAIALRGGGNGTKKSYGGAAWGFSEA